MREIEHTSLALSSSWKRFASEILALLSVLLALDMFAFAGDRFASVSPHPFWLVVILAAAQYGVLAGVLAATASSVALYAGAMPPRETGMDFYNYAALVTWQPALWWAAAATLGGLRRLHIHNAAQTEAKLAETAEQARTIAAGFKRACAEIDQLEARVAAGAGGVDGVLRGLAQLDLRNRNTYVEALGGMVAEVLGPAALYLRSATGLIPVTDAPRLSAATLAALADGGNAITATSDPALLPPGTALIAPIVAADSGALHGAILIERIATGEQALERTTARATILACALGRLLDAAAPQQPNVVMQTERRLAIAD